MSDMRIDIYPVGLLSHIKQGSVRYGVRYVLKRARSGDWRAVRNYFNGYLAEPQEWPVGTVRHLCGRGWTERAALRRLHRNIGGAS